MMNSIPDYINCMCNGDIDTLEQIISHQYRKFKKFHKLISTYSDIISTLKYEFVSESSLDIALSFDTKKRLSSIKKELEASMDSNGYDGDIKIEKKEMMISIFLDE